MEPIDWNDLEAELHNCHPALMRVWKQYRDLMYRRGYNTMDATQEVCVRVLAKKHELKNQTRAGFCAWSQTILRYWILEKLRRRRPGQMDSAFDVADKQGSPSRVSEKELRHAAYELARAEIHESDRVLIELRFENKLPKEQVRGCSIRGYLL